MAKALSKTVPNIAGGGRGRVEIYSNTGGEHTEGRWLSAYRHIVEFYIIYIDLLYLYYIMYR